MRRGQSILLILHASGVGAHRLALERTCRHVKSTLTFTTPYPRGSFARSGGCLQQCSRSIHAPVTSLVLVCGVPVVISTLQGQHAQSSRAPPRPAARTPRSKMEQCPSASSVGEDIEDTPKPEFEGYCQNMSSVQYWGQKTHTPRRGHVAVVRACLVLLPCLALVFQALARAYQTRRRRVVASPRPRRA